MHQFAECIELYQELLRGLHRQPATLKNYSLAVREFASFCQTQTGLTDLRQLEPGHFSSYVRFLRERPLSPLTAYGRQRLVRTWLAWLTLQGHLLLDPAKNHDWRHPRLLPRGSPSESQVTQFLQLPSLHTLSGQRDRAILEFLYGTGLRIAECCALDLEHLCLVTLQVQVRHGKGGRQRVVPFGPKLGANLNDYLHKLRPQLEKSASQALWLEQRGQRVTTVGLQQRLRALARASGLPITAHSLRHAYATHLLTHGAPVVALQKLLGHATLSMTTRYVSLVPLDVQQSVHKTHPRGRQRTEKR